MNAIFRPACLAGCLLLCFALPVQAQSITSDTTLPTNSAVTSPDSLNFTINGGTQAGSNLFHSFSEFSVPTNGSANFNNAVNIQNIFSRVTGSNVSNIDGLLRTNGTANLFLLNPNGILFGPNAQLNIGGSFYATTGDRLLFSPSQYFSATDTAGSSLLTISTPIGIQFGANPGNLTVDATFIGLNGSGQNLIFAGNNFRLDPGHIRNPGGRVEVASIGGSGTVGITLNGGVAQLSIPNTIQRSDITFDNHAYIEVDGALGGSIALTGSNIAFSGDSGLINGVNGIGTVTDRSGNINLNATGAITLDASRIFNEVRVGAVGSAGEINLVGQSLVLTNGGQIYSSTLGQGNGGAVTVNIGDRTEISGLDPLTQNNSGIFTSVRPSGVGNAGNLTLNTGSLSLTAGGAIMSDVLGQGNTGNVSVRASEQILIDSDRSSIENVVRASGVGIVQTTTLSGGDLTVANNAAIRTVNENQGNSGDLNLNFDGVIQIDNSRVLTETPINATGDAGDIRIVGRSLLLTNGGLIAARAEGQGNAGNISLQIAEATQLSGTNQFNFPAAIQTYVLGTGNAGNISVNTGSLRLSESAKISASAYGGNGNAGDIDITATGAIELIGGEGFTTMIKSETGDNIGDSGNITITADSLTLFQSEIINGVYGNSRGNVGTIDLNIRGALEVRSVTSDSHGGIFTSNYSDNQPIVGNGGAINVRAGSLTLAEGAGLHSDQQGIGNAGDITIQVDGLTSIDGFSPVDGKTSISASIYDTAVGNAGNIQLTTGSLSLTNGGSIFSTTAVQGNAGNITLNVRDRTTISGSAPGTFGGSSISNRVDPTGVGNAGNIALTTGSLTIDNNGAISSDTAGRGNAGNISIQARDRITMDNAGIYGSVASTGIGNGQTISIVSDSIQLSNGSVISATTDGQGNAGNINLNANNAELTSGGQIYSSSNSSGNAGNITANIRDRLSISNDNSAILATTGTQSTGAGGNVQINAQQVNLTNQAEVSVSSQGQGSAGNLTVNASNLSLSDRARLAAEAANGNGGNATITADTINLSQSSQITTNVSDTATGGRLNLSGDRLQVQSGSQVTASTSSSGNAGTLNATFSEAIAINGTNGNGAPSTLGASVLPGGAGNGGNLNITTPQLSLINGGQVTVGTAGAGNAGDLNIRASEVVTVQGESNNVVSRISADTSTTASGNGGSIAIQTGNLQVNDRAEITVGSQGSGSAGNLSVRAEQVQLNRGDLRADARSGDRGSIQIQASDNVSLRQGSMITTNASGTATGGALQIESDRLLVAEGSKITAATASSGQAGNLTVRADDIEVRGQTSSIAAGVLPNGTGNGGSVTLQTRNLNVRNGGQITASTQGSGNAGDINIQAVNRLTVRDSGSRITATSNTDATAGSINIRTPNLSVRDRADISVSGNGTGGAGDLSITARRIELDNRGRLSAEVAAGDRGNINLTAEVLSLSDQSLITTNATGTAQGGRINLDTDLIVGANNSDIVARAQQGRGGNIRVNAQALINIAPRPELTPLSDINVGSDSGLDGTIDLILPTFDLPTNLPDLNDLYTSTAHTTQSIATCRRQCSLTALSPDRAIASTLPLNTSCQAIDQDHFTLSGRNGIPSNPTSELSGNRPWNDLRLPGQEIREAGAAAEEQVQTSTTETKEASTPHPFTEAQAWITAPSGQVILISQAPTASATWQQTPTTCPGR
jgi:filamentous hemagglutinin family protein